MFPIKVNDTVRKLREEIKYIGLAEDTDKLSALIFTYYLMYGVPPANHEMSAAMYLLFPEEVIDLNIKSNVDNKLSEQDAKIISRKYHRLVAKAEKQKKLHTIYFKLRTVLPIYITPKMLEFSYLIEQHGFRLPSRLATNHKPIYLPRFANMFVSLLKNTPVVERYLADDSYFQIPEKYRIYMMSDNIRKKEIYKWAKTVLDVNTRYEFYNYVEEALFSTLPIPGAKELFNYALSIVGQKQHLYSRRIYGYTYTYFLYSYIYKGLPPTADEVSGFLSTIAERYPSREQVRNIIFPVLTQLGLINKIHSIPLARGYRPLTLLRAAFMSMDKIIDFEITFKGGVFHERTVISNSELFARNKVVSTNEDKPYLYALLKAIENVKKYNEPQIVYAL